MDIDKVDTWLGAVQKVALIVGLCVSAWIFLIKEETSPHVKMVANSKVLNNCVLRVDVQAENKGGRVWNIENAIARVFKPNFERIQTSENLKELEIRTQILKINQSLHIGESSSFGFNMMLPNNELSFVIVKVAMKIKEDGSEWLRVTEEAIPISSC